jgi:hypothetical protein
MAKLLLADSYHPVIKYVHGITKGIAANVPSSRGSLRPETSALLESTSGARLAGLFPARWEAER